MVVHFISFKVFPLLYLILDTFVSLADLWMHIEKGLDGRQIAYANKTLRLDIELSRIPGIYLEGP